MFMTPHLDSHSTTDPEPELLSLSKPEKEFHIMEEMYEALCMCMCMCAKKTTFLAAAAAQEVHLSVCACVHSCIRL